MEQDGRDFLREKAVYERRIVAFYDVLGWRSKIESAGTDPDKITALKNVIRIFSNTKPDAAKYPFDYRQTTFSDNVVISSVVSDQSVFNFILRLGFAQVLSACLGFFIRGGVTVGDIVHDEHVVFGPALNRAYELESQVAQKPRILLDPEVLEPLGGLKGVGSMVATEGDVLYLNPWTQDNVGTLWMVTSASKTTTFRSHNDLLMGPLLHIIEELKTPLDDKVRDRLTWLQGLLFEALRPK